MSAVLEFLDKYQVDHSEDHHHSRPGWTQIQTCPFCGSTNYHLGIKLDGSRAACYKCGGKSAAKALKEVSGAGWRDVLSVTKEGIFTAPEVEKDCGVYTPPSGLMPLQPMHTQYLKGRGFDPAYCEAVWGFQGTGPFSSYPFRVFIPIIYRKRPVSWTARAIRGQEPKYQTAQKHEKSLDEKKILLGLDHVKKSIIVVEGPLSAIAIGRGATATFGLSVTTAQINHISRYAKRIICFDSEPAAQARAHRLAENLAVFPGETVVVALDSADPAEALLHNPAELKMLRKFAFGSTGLEP